jgi:hypothetical protein
MFIYTCHECLWYLWNIIYFYHKFSLSLGCNTYIWSLTSLILLRFKIWNANDLFVHNLHIVFNSSIQLSSHFFAISIQTSKNFTDIDSLFQLHFCSNSIQVKRCLIIHF